MQRFLDEFLLTLAMLAPFLLLGCIIAGLLHAFVPRSLLARAMGGSGIGPISRASLMGIPLPLCSCSVIPVATELRRQGAGRGATTAFMVSTPETGVDSISTSVAVLHPVLVVARPIAAMITSVIVGLAVERFSPEPEADDEEQAESCRAHDAGEDAKGPARGLVGGVRYAFGDLLGEISPYLLPALLLTALLGVLIEPDQLAVIGVEPWLQRLILLVAGIPIYVCATSATPIAAGMIVAGLSPGAALVFLLAGPATNIVTISAVKNTLGKRAAIVYVTTVGVTSYGFGTLVDVFWRDLVPDSEPTAHLHHDHLSWLHWSCAVVLGVMIFWHIGRKLRNKFRTT
jgi:uncharacterized membrane protein YraQ (UPF0718 family)